MHTIYDGCSKSFLSVSESSGCLIASTLVLQSSVPWHLWNQSRFIKLIFFLLLCWKIAEQKTNLFECFSNKYLSNYVGPNPGSDMIYIILYCIADLDWGDVIFKIWIRIFRHKEGQNIFLLNYQFLRKKKITVDIWLWLIGTELLLSNKNNLEVTHWHWHWRTGTIKTKWRIRFSQKQLQLQNLFSRKNLFSSLGTFAPKVATDCIGVPEAWILLFLVLKVSKSNLM